MKKIHPTTRVFIGDSATTKHIDQAMQDLTIKTLSTAHLQEAMPKPSESPPTGNSGAAQQSNDPKK